MYLKISKLKRISLFFPLIKRWIESCIREELPSTYECEENLRNGVYLAKLSNFFCPEKVPFKRIFDKDQSKFQYNGIQFRHTDNINHWFNAMEHIGLPKIFFPETTDIYDKKNMPRVVYCLHALRYTTLQNNKTNEFPIHLFILCVFLKLVSF